MASGRWYSVDLVELRQNLEWSGGSSSVFDGNPHAGSQTADVKWIPMSNSSMQ